MGKVPRHAGSDFDQIKETAMGEVIAESSSVELMVDLIISLGGYASVEGWPGWWGLEGPEYLAWLEQEGEKGYSFLLGANTYRLMSSMSLAAAAGGSGFPGVRGPTLRALLPSPRLSFPRPCSRT